MKNCSGDDVRGGIRKSTGTFLWRQQKEGFSDMLRGSEL
jgi:hypothetical protein